MDLLKNIYVVERGTRTGQFLAMITLDKENRVYSALAMPECDPLKLTEKDVVSGIEANILKLVDTLPDDVYQGCKSEFEYRDSLKE